MATTLPATPHRSDIEQGIISSGNYSDEEPRRSSDAESATSCTVHIDEITPNPNNLSRARSSSSFSSASSCCYLSECSVEDIEVGGGNGEVNGEVAVVVESGKGSVNLSKVERDCRICHLSLDGSDPDSGLPIELGCSCKEDLGAAHKVCAETWFKIRGNKTCEICGSIARNVVGVTEVELMEQWSEANDITATPAVAHHHSAETTRHFWQGHRFLNFLLACMVFAFVISWLFHFNVPS